MGVCQTRPCLHMYVCVIAYVDVVPFRGRGGDRKRADDEDAVMDMDIDPGMGNWSYEHFTQYYNNACTASVCPSYCSSLIVLIRSPAASGMLLSFWLKFNTL